MRKLSTTFTENFSDNDILVLYAKNLIHCGEKSVKDKLNECWNNHKLGDVRLASHYSAILSAIDLDNEIELTTKQLHLLLGSLQIFR